MKLETLMLIALGLAMSAVALADSTPKRRYELVREATDQLVSKLAGRTDDKVVMFGRFEGDHVDLIQKAIQESLLAQGIERANTKEEIEALRAQYKAQGQDVYQNPEMQRLLRMSSKAKLTLELESHCDKRISLDGSEANEECDIWLRGLLPATTVFSEHASYRLQRAEAPAAANPWVTARWFLLLLIGYALLPPFLHRLDVQARRLDGSWRSVLLFPVYLIGNRLITFVLVISFPIVGPYFFERWIGELPSTPEGIIRTTGIAIGAMLALHLTGVLFVSFWRDGKRGGRYGATFRELCVFHPHFWTRELEGRLGR